MTADEDKYRKFIIVHPKHIFHGKYTCILMSWGAVG